MANHKRKGPKSTRAGCLLCKPHKAQWMKDTEAAKTQQERRADLREAEQRLDQANPPT